MNKGWKGPFHVINWRPGHMPGYLTCFRCKRNLHEDQFVPLNRIFSPLKVGQGAAAYYVQYLHPHCQVCRRQSYGQHCKHPLYTPQMDRYWSKRASAIKSASHKRGVICLIDKDDLLGQHLRQDGKCAITGVPMTCNLVANGKHSQASVDRIDSGGNYSIDNIQIVCNIVNIMKHDMPQSEFLKWCKAVIDGQARREDELASLLG